MKVFDLDHYFATYEPNNGRFFTIAIDGRGASGKSALAEYLKKLLPDFVILNGDDYFEPINHQDVRGDFNDERFKQDIIAPLNHGNMFPYRPYDWHAEPHISERQVTVTKGFCLERCCSFTFDLDWDLRIWVETPKDTCLERGLARENMPRDRVLKAWQVWQAAEDKYIQDFNPASKAGLVVDGTKPLEEQII